MTGRERASERARDERGQGRQREIKGGIEGEAYTLDMRSPGGIENQ